jgi:hypothetical protein
MSNLTARIQALDPAKAERILNAIAQYRVSRGLAANLTPDAALVTDLAAAADTTLDSAASAGDLAKASLLLLADDPAMTPVLDAMIANPPAETFAVDPGTLVIGVAALVILQSYVKFERDKNGKWTFKVEKKPMSDTLLKQVISKLGGWFGRP